MEEFVAYIVKNLVSETDAVQVSCIEEPERLKIEIRVAQEDVGKIIGRKGNTINAIRTIVRTVATRLGRKVQIDLIQEEKEKEEVVAEAEAEPQMDESAEPVEV